MEEGDLEKVTLRIPSRHIRALDFLVQVDDFPSRSEAIRAAIRDFIYARLDLKRMEEAEKIMAEMEAYEERYLRK